MMLPFFKRQHSVAFSFFEIKIVGLCSEKRFAVVVHVVLFFVLRIVRNSFFLSLNFDSTIDQSHSKFRLLPSL